MTQWLKQSTVVSVKLGPFVDDTDGKTAETAISIARADIRLTKNGGAFAQTNNTAGATHDENGYYDVPLDTTDTNTLGLLRVAISKTGALPVWQDFMVIVANVFDSLIGNVDLLQVDTAQWLNATAPTMTGDAYARIGAAGAGLTALGDTRIANLDAAVSSRSTYAGADTSGTTTLLGRVVGTVAAGTHNPQSGDAYARIGAAGAGLTALGDTRIANLDATVSSRTKPADTQPANVTQISGSTTAADNLEASALAVEIGTAVTGTLTTTSFTTNLTDASNDHYVGRVVIFTSGALAKQGKAILDYDGTTKTLTTRAFTEAPGNGDTFVIV